MFMIPERQLPKSGRKRSASGPTKPISPSTLRNGLRPMRRRSTTVSRLQPKQNAFKVGSNIAIHEDEESVKEFFARFGLIWNREYAAYLGTLAIIKSVKKNGNVVLHMHDGKDLVFAGVDSLIHRGDSVEEEDPYCSKSEESDEENDERPSDFGETEIKSWSKQWSEEKQSSSEVQRVTKNDFSPNSGEIRLPEKDEDCSEGIMKWKRGDKVNVILRDELQQGTVVAVNHNRSPPYDVYLDCSGMTYQMHPQELEECLNPESSDILKMKHFLEIFNLQVHSNGLINEGFESLSDLDNAEMEDLLAVGMKRGHARRLFRALKEYKANSGCCVDETRRHMQRCSSFGSNRGSFLNSMQDDKIVNTHLYGQPTIPDWGISSTRSRSQSVPFASGMENNYQSICYQNSNTHPTQFISSMKHIPVVANNRNSFRGGEDGYVTIYFDQRPIGFGTMSPLVTGTMVSTITDDSLKTKGLDLGLPLLLVNNLDVSQSTLEEVAIVLTQMELPFNITFGLQPYFKAGQKVEVLSNNKWYAATVIKMVKSTRKVAVKYDNSPFMFSNTEKIADYTRIRRPLLVNEVAEDNRDSAIRDKPSDDGEQVSQSRAGEELCKYQNAAFRYHQNYGAGYGQSPLSETSSIRQMGFSGGYYPDIPYHQNLVPRPPQSFSMTQDNGQYFTSQLSDARQYYHNEMDAFDQIRNVQGYNNQPYLKDRPYLTEEQGAAIMRENAQALRDNERKTSAS